MSQVTAGCRVLRFSARDCGRRGRTIREPPPSSAPLIQVNGYPGCRSMLGGLLGACGSQPWTTPRRPNSRLV